jgi:hypothetical protein
MLRRVALLVAPFVLAFRGTAAARIVIGRGMFGASLGQTMHQVRTKLGTPDLVTQSAAGPDWLYVRPDLQLSFHGKAKRLTDLSTESPSQRTSRGVGVGSSQKDVMRLVPGVHCSVLQGCVVISRRRGKVYETDFETADGSVLGVSIDLLTKP